MNKVIENMETISLSFIKEYMKSHDIQLFEHISYETALMILKAHHLRGYITTYKEDDDYSGTLQNLIAGNCGKPWEVIILFTKDELKKQPQMTMEQWATFKAMCGEVD